MKKIRRFKFLREGLRSNYNKFQWRIGKWHKTECLDLCHGFNCSEKILDAMSYVKGEILAEVEAKGKHFTGDDKSTWPEMRIIKAWKWQKKDSVALSIFAAELVIENYEKVYLKGNRPRKAIEAAKAWLQNPSEENRSAAESAWFAARSAAWSAVWSAKSAAWSAKSAAKSAAESAAWSAKSAAESATWSAWSATESSESAARSAAWSATKSAAESAWSAAINNWLIEHLNEMSPLKIERG